MEERNLIMALAVVIAVLVIALLVATDVIKLPTASKYKNVEEVSNATVNIGSKIENVGSTLEEIDKNLG